VLDNISTIPGWFSDILCKASTGDGYIRRQLYTDSELSVLSFRRCIWLTSIDPGSIRGDLGDRLLPIELTRIDDSNRRTDTELQQVYSQIRPGVLRELLDLTQRVLCVLPDVQLDRLPRMADFGRVLAALDQVHGTDACATFLGLRAELSETIVSDDLVASAVRDLIGSRGRVQGTATELLTLLPKPDPTPRSWPKTASALGARLARVAPALRNLGYAVTSVRTANSRYWILEELARESVSQVSLLSRTDPELAERDDSSSDTDGCDDVDAVIPRHREGADHDANDGDDTDSRVIAAPMSFDFDLVGGAE
jgi:hypothetical protein